MDNLLNNVIVLPDNNAFYQRESGMAHTSYMIECAFYSLIQQGETDKAIEAFHSLINNSIVVGKMSANSFRQMQYWAVCCITLGTRYAIQGGLDEMTAFNTSDRFIQLIDKLQKSDDILSILEMAVKELTQKVKKQAFSHCSKPVKEAINYVMQHLHEKILIEDVTIHVNISPDYLQKLFKKELGYSIHRLIIDKKLEEGKRLLNGENAVSTIAYVLAFCSQTHFIRLFKQKYGVTPKQYSLNLKNLS